MTCKCVYATAANTESVRKGYEMGGYLKEECEVCKGFRASQAAQVMEAMGWIKLAHYFYPKNQIVIYGKNGSFRVRTEKMHLPTCPIRKVPFAHPIDDMEYVEAFPSYEEIGLYYGYNMPGTGWVQEGF